MPTYQYACTACGHQLEAVQSFSDAPLTACPECDGHLRKVFSSVGIVFKGSGFYRTDSRSAPTDGKASGDSKGSTDSAGTSTPASSGSDSGSTSASSSSSGSTSSGSSGSSTSSAKPAATVSSS